MVVRHAKISEISDILSITKACASFMISKGIYQLNEQYPSKEAFLNDIQRKELYVLEDAETLVGVIVVSTYMDKEYIPIQWLSKNGANIYIHRLAVHPNFQRRGYAQKLMDFAENYARKNEYISIRLDTFSQNKRNQKFYETRGYKKLGNIYFPKQSTHPFHCYELVL